eukprot:4292295-Amphidinium_carterae.5
MNLDRNEYVTDYPLKEQYIEYMTIIEGDTKEAGIRLQQLQDLDDDIRSIVDKEQYEEREAPRARRMIRPRRNILATTTVGITYCTYARRSMSRTSTRTSSTTR